ncbi:McrB family protein [Telluria beijingensis]|uniref:McrB family protein n=1 Tax=Telluria beijingensis TaxID=3068633 RepID=UPI0027959457|nr:AAA family ATPase [Massilia sp. REN29]
MLDNYLNGSAKTLFERFPDDDDRTWAAMAIAVLKARYPMADHYTAGGEEFGFIDIRIGRKTEGVTRGQPVFLIRQHRRNGPVSLLASRLVLTSGARAVLERHDAPTQARVEDWLDALGLNDDGRKRLRGSGRSPVDYTLNDRGDPSEDPDATQPAQAQSTAEQGQALNRILYGPPGTGKTYRTTREALSIIEGTPTPAGDHADHRKRFDALRNAGRIAFVTFHQSFSYEDFIEGIRAEAVGGQLSYKVRDGIFKRMAITAMYRQPVRPAAGRAPEFDDVHEAFIAEVEAGLPYEVMSSTGSHLAIAGVNDNGTFLVTHANRTLRHGVSRKRLKALYEAYPDRAALGKKSAVNAISSVIGSSNATVYWAVLDRLLEFKERVQAGLEDEHGEVDVADEPPEYEQIKRRVLGGEDLAPNGKPYVLIIDEINRGNMSRIFGELITLIETSKRAGGNERAEVQLPYSNERFSVPDNLYVIGTMNTADRSLAVVDTALRRRFDFIEMMPDLEALKHKKVEGVDIARMLGAINLRIEHLYDREHTIGHSFFIHLEPQARIADLARIFRNNVLPLLEEYFYEDWEKIDKVLGNAGIYQARSSDKLGFAQKTTIWRRNEGKLLLAETYRQIYTAGEAAPDTPAPDSDG